MKKLVFTLISPLFLYNTYAVDQEYFFNELYDEFASLSVDSDEVIRCNIESHQIQDKVRTMRL